MCVEGHFADFESVFGGVEFGFCGDVEIETIFAEIDGTVLTFEADTPDGFAAAAIAFVVVMKDVFVDFVLDF